MSVTMFVSEYGVAGHTIENKDGARGIVVKQVRLCGL